MKTFNLRIIPLFFLLSLFGTANAQDADKPNWKTRPGLVDGFDFTVKIKDMPDTNVILGYYYADKQYVHDTFRTDSKGLVRISGKEKLPGGIYLIAIPNYGYFEIAYSGTEKGFYIETSMDKPLDAMKIKNSKENELFLAYQKQRIKQGKLSDLLGKRFEANKDNQDSVKAIRAIFTEYEKKVKEQQIKLANDNPNTLIATIINLMREPEIPNPKPHLDGSPIDTQLFRYVYFKKHYWDYVDFTNESILRTPIYKNKVMKYLGDQLTPQHPDSITKYAMFVIDKAYQGNYEVFKSTITWIASKYEKSNIMGFDAIFVYIAQKYYLTGKVDWLSDEQMKKVEDRVKKMANTIIGHKSKELLMLDINGVPRSLHNTPGDYKLVYFWSATCGHCKKVTPRVKAIYDEYKDKGFIVYAVNVDSKAIKDKEGNVIDLVNTQEYKDYVKEHKLDWINVSDPLHKTLFRNYYDIYSTPVIYLLDKDNKLIAKRLADCQIKEMLMRLIDKASEEELEKYRKEHCSEDALKEHKEATEEAH